MKSKKDCMIHKDWDEKDEILKETLYEMSGRISASESLKRQIDSRLFKEEKGRTISMKRFSMKKMAIGVAAACLVLGTASIAGSGIKSYVSHGSAIPDYTKFEDLGKAEEKAGYRIDAVEVFENGYKMKSIDISDVSLQNEAGQKEQEQKEIYIYYEKPGAERIWLSACKLFAGEAPETAFNISAADKTMQYGDVIMIFNKTTYKFVPPDYELTDEDQKALESGAVEISYGTSDVEIKEAYSVGWVKDGIVYNLGGFDLALAADEMLGMAGEIIESGVKY
ncbi:hypothetical protein EDD76_101148 [Kineothrix alysoides]|uniref:DUF4367 domain-containing protein n=1 Tax=Kineothrix alysoides TaxID=1469948 RepID=A0A4R1R666_9FIRM|nr:hypothetical protein [Kineothrix alysoides]TCL61051.1 hypothetical protein EDD76_101148 [Kineothrix alysoides]